MDLNEGRMCDFCCTRIISGRRFKCLKCADYNLCGLCYDNGIHHGQHPMQCLLTQSAFDLFYLGEHMLRIRALTCPYCVGELGFDIESLLNHVKEKHDNGSSIVAYCPICICRHTRRYFTARNFLSHLAKEHITHHSGNSSFINQNEANTVLLFGPRVQNVPRRRNIFLINGQVQGEGPATTQNRVLEPMEVCSPTESADSNGDEPPPSDCRALESMTAADFNYFVRQRFRLADESFASTSDAGPIISSANINSERNIPNRFVRLRTAVMLHRHRVDGGGGVDDGATGHGYQASSTKSDFLLKALEMSNLNERQGLKNNKRLADHALFVESLILSSMGTDFINESEAEN